MSEEAKFVLVMYCRDCGIELDRTRPLEKAEVNRAMMASGLNNVKCPKGCRSTFSDCNWNTRIEQVSVQE